ncbi:MAG: hypothetical protein MJZ11_08345 [Lachnospiraceae bacterium]|nr:hypothetical protein [Lachnospiraceae bacterium]
MEEIKNFIYSHSSPNGCVALTRSERDELISMIEKHYEKLKCCHNCKYSFRNGGHEEKCEGCWTYESKEDFQINKKTYLHWKCKE